MHAGAVAVARPKQRDSVTMCRAPVHTFCWLAVRFSLNRRHERLLLENKIPLKT